MKPTVGRIVHYGVNGLPCAAIITAVTVVNGKDRIALRTFGPIGDDKIDLDAPYAETLTDGHWSWPPRVP